MKNLLIQKILKYSTIIFAMIGFFLVSGYIAVRTGLTNTSGIIDNQTKTFLQTSTTSPSSTSSVPKLRKYEQFPLAHTPEWIAFRQAVTKDKNIIEKISKNTGVSPRLLVAILVPEQMRLFHSNRAIFKQVFEPLKVLGSQSQFSWGIFGIKDDTARDIESHLTDKDSPFYLGTSFEHSLDFKTTDHDQERFQRIIDEYDHTYSYLYTAIYLSQIKSQWKKAGFDISNHPEILATLFNLGFEKSTPNANPKSGGAPIDINGTIWSFGALAENFYNSDEMIEILP